MTRALLVAMMNPPADEAGYNVWYDDEHFPLRIGTPGFLNGRRYRAPEVALPTRASEGVPDSSPHPRYLAFYDLESVEVLASEPYLRLGREPSDRERRVLPSIPYNDRRVLELVLDGPEWTTDAPYVLLTCMTPAAGGEDDYVVWYRDEHVGALLKVPGWRRARLFRQLDGRGPAFMAMHELESLAVFDCPEYAAANATPWRQRIRASVTRYERDVFALLTPNPSRG